jgi:hypothetical protein
MQVSVAQLVSAFGKSAIPEDWTKTIQAEIHNRKNNRTVDINVNRDSKILDFKLCTTVDEILQVVHKK